MAGYSSAGWYQPRDTPEVEAAKAAHFARYNYEAARNTLGAYAAYPYYNSPALSYQAAVPIAYSSPYAYGPAPLGPDGRVIDTPEVSAAKAVHFAAHSKVRNLPSTQSSRDYPVPSYLLIILSSHLSQSLQH